MATSTVLNMAVLAWANACPIPGRFSFRDGEIRWPPPRRNRFQGPCQARSGLPTFRISHVQNGLRVVHYVWFMLSRVLLTTTVRWPSTARLVAAFAGVGVQVQALLP